MTTRQSAEPHAAAPPAAPAVAPIPQSGDARIGMVLQDRYRILAPLGAGGMGAVYRAERLKLGRVVAVKFLHHWGAKDPQLARRFEIEAQAMSRLAHPNCVSVIDFGVADSPYLVMDLVTGRTLLEVARGARLPAARAIRITRQVLAGLAHAHAQGIIHRDIKPENVVLEQAPGFDDHVRIVDFGLAKLIDNQANLTRGVVLGTPSYMAPEQVRVGRIDARTDIYAVGILLFEMLTGRPPFQHREVAEVFQSQLRAPPPPLRRADPEGSHSAALETVVLRAMAKSPEERFATAAEFAAALESVPEAGGEARRPASRGGSPDQDPALDATAHAGSQIDPVAAPAGVVPPERSAAGRRARVMAVVSSVVVRARGMVQGRGGRLLRLVPVAREAGKALARGHRWIVGRTRLRPGTLVACGAAGLVGLVVAALALLREEVAPRAPAPPVPAVAAAAPRALGDGTGPALAAVTALARAGERERALRLLAELRRERPADGDLAALQARLFFEKRWWSEGVAAYRVALQDDPARAGDPVLVGHLIRALQSGRFARRAAELLRELGEPARPFVARAAREHDSPSVRARAATLLDGWPAHGSGAGGP